MFGFFSKKKKKAISISREVLEKLAEEMTTCILKHQKMLKGYEILSEEDKEALYQSLFYLLPRALLISAVIDQDDVDELVHETLRTIVRVFCDRNNINLKEAE